jgi:hypothetical protein
MKIYLGLLFFLVSFLSFAQKKIDIGGYTFYSKKTSRFLKDDSLTTVWVTFYNKKNESIFGYESVAMRNDSVFRRGAIELDQKRRKILYREIFYYTQSWNIDSVHKEFFVNQKGGVILKKDITFKNGILKVRYP